ncbi:hypothetical protein L9F63_008455, partial [Diploptera punctata]
HRANVTVIATSNNSANVAIRRRRSPSSRRIWRKWQPSRWVVPLIEIGANKTKLIMYIMIHKLNINFLQAESLFYVQD